MMARRKLNAPLSVVLNGRDVGILTKASSGAIGFRYGQTWLEEENAIPVSLSLPLREDGYIGEPVIAVFENLLPDNKPEGAWRRSIEQGPHAASKRLTLRRSPVSCSHSTMQQRPKNWRCRRIGCTLSRAN